MGNQYITKREKKVKRFEANFHCILEKREERNWDDNTDSLRERRRLDPKQEGAFERVVLGE